MTPFTSVSFNQLFPEVPLIPQGNYEKISGFKPLKKNTDCLILPHLHPDYCLYFGKIHQFFFLDGSLLCHFALVARSLGVSLLRLNKQTDQLLTTGAFDIVDQTINFYAHPTDAPQ